MKTVYNIPLDASESTAANLLIEIGATGLSLFWTGIDPMTIKGVCIYTFEENENIIAAVKDIFNTNCLNSQTHRSVTVGYNFKETLLVPANYFNPALNEEMLSLVHGQLMNVTIKSDEIRTKNIYNVYSIPTEIDLLLEETFPLSNRFHSNTKQIQTAENKNKLICSIFYDSIKVILFKNDVLEIVQQYKFNTPENVVYHLLNICQQHEVTVEEITLVISGMITEDSQLYKQLYNYFINIEFDNIPDNVSVEEKLQFLPAHFLRHLTTLASCE